MRVVALLHLRDEAAYLHATLGHLTAQGIETCVIDNGSTDQSRAIAESFRDRGVIRIIDYPYPGFYDLTGILKLKERLAADLEADWFIQHDADEIREAPPPWSTLAEGIEAVDRGGWNAINFDEFVFVPTQEYPDHEAAEFVSTMRHYYYFQPRPLHRVNAWKKTGAAVDLVSSGGHRASFPGCRIAPQSFPLRHYVFLSLDHGIRKYTKERVYSQREIEELGWHRARARLTSADIVLPAVSEMKRLEQGFWDTSQPYRFHPFMRRGRARMAAGGARAGGS